MVTVFHGARPMRSCILTEVRWIPSQPVSLEYGIHQIIAKADGYKSLTQYLRVGQESAGVDVQLDKVDSDRRKAQEVHKARRLQAALPPVLLPAVLLRRQTPQPPTIGYTLMHRKTEAYLDGNYVGISPCSFKRHREVT